MIEVKFTKSILVGPDELLPPCPVTEVKRQIYERMQEEENRRLVEVLILPELCGPMGRVMP